MQSLRNPTAVCRAVDGVRVSHYFNDDNVRSALAYKAQPSDVFVVSFPKCGTTWLQYLVLNIFSGGAPPKSKAEFHLRTPYLEYNGVRCLARMPGLGAIKTHLPFHRVPYSKDAKYLYITRNPYDCCVSYYHQTKRTPAFFFEDGTFEEFLDGFMEGNWEYGDYFDHLLSWYDRRHDPNVFFLTYEDLKKDTGSWVLKMADFLGEEYGHALRGDEAMLERIVEASSVASMKRLFNGVLNRSTGRDDVYGSLKSDDASVQAALVKPLTADFVRKGIVGDWRNHFTPDLIERMKGRMAAKTAGSDVMKLWRDCELP